METTSIDQYFEKVRSLPVAMSFEEVQALVKIKGITTNHQSWWKSKNFIFMTTTAIIITSAILFFSTSKEIEQLPVAEKKEAKQKVSELLHKKEKQITQAREVSINSNTPVVSSTDPLLTLQKDVPILQNEVPLLSREPFSETPFIEAASGLGPVMSTNNLLLVDTMSKNDRIDGHTKTITKELSATSVDLIVVSNFKGDISILTWDKPTVKMDAYITISGGSEGDIEKALQDFDLDLVGKGSKIEIENRWSKNHDCNCTEASIKGKITTKRGEKIRVKKYNIDYVITVPNKMNLDLKDSYGDITIKDIVGNVKGTSFQGDFIAGNISGVLDLNQKYGDVKVGDFSEGEVTLFHSEANLGNTQQLELDAKYSDVSINGVDELDLTAFQTDIDIETKVKEIKGNLKYGDLLIEGNANLIDLDVFQAKVEVKNVIDFDVEGSYSNFKAKSIENLYAASSFQNSYRIGTVSIIKGDSRYTSFDIGVLKGELDLKTFQGHIDIDEVLGSFRKLDINSKYTPIDLNFSTDAKFYINAETSYTDFDYPEKSMQVEEEDIEHHKMSFKGIFNANNNKEPSTVNIICFQGKLNLR